MNLAAQNSGVLDALHPDTETLERLPVRALPPWRWALIP